MKRSIELMWHRRRSRKRMWIDASLLIASSLVVSICRADRDAESRHSLEFDRSALSDTVFEARPHQRLLDAAQNHISDGNYTAAFDVLHDLLQQSHDSCRRVPGGSIIHGTRSAALRSISKLPFSARRAWNQFCQGSGTAALNKALRSGSRVALARVAAEFPCSSVAADALISEAIFALNTRQITAAQLAMKQLLDLMPMGVLTRPQITAVRKLHVAVDHHSDLHGDARITDTSAPLRSLDGRPNWGWKDNAWRHPQGPDALPRRTRGSQFDSRDGWQHPILSGGTVITRTPAGIACLDRFTGAQQWFLPFRSVVAPRPSDNAVLDATFEITRDPQQRLEVSGDMIFFVDGQQVAPIQPSSRIRSPLVLLQGATHLVAIRAGPRPAVLWEVSSETGQELTATQQSAVSAQRFQYAFETSAESLPSATNLRNGAPTNAADRRLTGHLFLSAPRTHGGRLYVTSHHDGMTWLNCLSATHGSLHWQQPLTWLESDSEHDQQDSAIVGGITQDVVVCLFASGLIAGCNPIDGRIEWIQSVLFHDEAAAELDDFWRTQSDSRVIPQTGAGREFGSLQLLLSPAGIICTRRGSPGISCLNTTTGEIRWSTSRSVQGGIAAEQQDLLCIGLIGSHLITAGCGHCRAIRVDDGSQTWIRPMGNHSGRICIDQQAVYVALDSGRLLTIDGNDGTVLRSQQSKLSEAGPGLALDETGIVEASAWSVRSWPWQNELKTSSQPGVEEALDTLATHRLRELQRLTPHSTAVAEYSVEACVAVATTAELSTDQRLRFALISPDLSNHEVMIKDELRRKPDQLMQLLPGWTMQLSIAIHTLGLSRMASDVPLSLNDSVLFPSRSGPLDTQFATVDDLISHDRLNQAELLLLNMNLAPDSQEAAQRDQLLRTVRARDLAPGILPTVPADHVTAVFHVTSNNTDGFRLNDIAASYHRFLLETPAAVVPAWSQAQFITEFMKEFKIENGDIAEIGTSAHVGLVNVGRGIETAWMYLSADQLPPIDTFFPRNVSFQEAWNSPGLVVVSPKRRIGVISLLSDAPLAPLWLQPLDDDAEGQVIALSSRQLFVSSNAGVESRHPLTGQVLWSRDWSQSRELQQMEGQFFKVYCSENHIILLSSLGTGYVVLRAADGTIVREDARRSGRLSRVIDEYLLTMTAHEQLEITHLVTGTQVPVDLGGHSVVNFHPAGQIGRAKAIVITAESELIILDLASGRVETRVQVPGGLDDVDIRLQTPRLIRRAGLIYIVLSVSNRRSPHLPESVFGDAVPGKGVVICIDPETGEELWQQEGDSLVIPHVFGDRCPFLVLWSIKYTNGRTQLRFRGGRATTSQEIKVLDAFTGETIARTEHRLAARPLQVVHDAEQRQLKITTDQSTIRMDYAE